MNVSFGRKMSLTVVVQLLSHVWLFVTPSTAAHQASLSFTISYSLLKLLFIELVMPSNPLILYCPLLLPSIFPASGCFPMSQPFTTGGQSIKASASVLPMNIQSWFPLGLTRLVSFNCSGCILISIYSLNAMVAETCFKIMLMYGAQSSLTLCDPMDCNPPVPPVHEILPARILEWVAISSSRGSLQPRDQTQVSCIGRQILYHWANREVPKGILSNGYFSVSTWVSHRMPRMFLDKSVRMFPGEISIWIVNSLKHTASLQVVELCPISWGPI